ncbi:MAG: DUF2156 domain-containing protein, partial [Candidatus Omnitrophica bacterium]|nr:DUF2156 domain-containing protein [Candidatus Omnitrophota bacterium]
SNKNKEVSRIENVEEKDIAFFQDAGYLCQQKYPEYLYSRKDLAKLKGDRFKAKRASCNYFIKHYAFKYREYSGQDKSACLKLYRSWTQARKVDYQDALYQGMLADSLKCLEILLADYKKLNFLGRAVEIEKEIKAFTPLHPGSRLLYKGDVTGFTFGYQLDNETFCILYEITELATKGLAQFIFRKFCAELKQYKYINVMDDSGLENLKKVKLSYHPIKLIPSYIVTRSNDWPN